MTVYPIWIKIKHVLFGSPIISNWYSNLFYNFHVTQQKCQNSSWILIRQALKFIVEPRWQHALLKQQCVDTVPSYASKFTSRTPNGTTSPTCRVPSYPATHSHRLLKILDTVAEQSICCLLALTVFSTTYWGYWGWCHQFDPWETLQANFTVTTVDGSFLLRWIESHVWVCHTFRLVLDRGWLRLLNLHGSEEVSTGSLWRSGVILLLPESWNIPMEIGRSLLQHDICNERG